MASNASNVQLFSRVRFRVKAPVQMGETVYVCGSHPLLGGWDPQKAVQLVTSPEAFPTWFHVDTIALPTKSRVEYKYMIMSGGNFQRYESFHGNRVIVPTAYECIAEDELDSLSPPPEPASGPDRDLSASMAAQPSGNTGLSSHSSEGGGSGTGITEPPALDPASGPVASGGQRHPPQRASTPPARHRRSGSDGPLPRSSVRARGVAGPAGEVMGMGHRVPRHKASRTEGATLAGSASGVRLTEADGVLVVVPQLPVLLTHNPNGAWRVAWDEEHLLSRKRPSEHFGGEMRLRVDFVGLPNVYVPPEEQEAVRAALAPYRCRPVFLSEETAASAVKGFCKDTLWPLFHNVVDVYGEYPTRWWHRERQSARWLAYMEMNSKFGDVVVEAYNEGDLVWIHDFHLLLLPSVLARRRLRSSNMGMFLHAPFPSSEIFRTLSVRDDLLRGMLNADHIGFHLFEYARHFLACCRRIMGLEHTIQGGGRIALHNNGRDVIITVCHAGVEPLFLEHKLATDEVAMFRAQLERTAAIPAASLARQGSAGVVPAQTLVPAEGGLGSAEHLESASPIETPKHLYEQPDWEEEVHPCSGMMKVVVGLDSLERLKGLPLKLVAFELFLQEYPAWVGHVTLVQVGVFDKSRAEDCTSTQAEVEYLVRRINGRFGPQALQARAGAEAATEAPPAQAHAPLGSLTGPVVHYMQRQGGVPMAERLALFSLGHVHLSVPFRDGLNLTPLEFMFAARGGAGVVVVSEFASCSRILPGAVRVNPWKVSAVAHGIATALRLPGEEVAARVEANRSCMGDTTTSMWAERVLLDLKRASQEGGSRTYMGFGLGLNYRQLGFQSNFRNLDVQDMLASYRRTSRRLFLLDYSGTLMRSEAKGSKAAATRRHAAAAGLLEKVSGSYLAEPPVPQAVKASLRALAKDPRNTVVVLSGKQRDVLEKAFEDCPEVCLAAEHGFYYKFGRAPGPLTSTPTYTPGSPGTPGVSPTLMAANHEWQQLGEHFDDSWMDLVAAYMEGYAARTNGTFVSRKSSSMVWHFGDADADFGRLQAKELVDHLTGLLKHFPVEVFQGSAYIEVRPRGVSKGAIAQHFIHLLEGRVAAGQATLMEQTNCASAGVDSEAVQAAAESAVTSQLARRARRGRGAAKLPAAGDATEVDAMTTDMEGDTFPCGQGAAGGVAPPFQVQQPTGGPAEQPALGRPGAVVAPSKISAGPGRSGQSGHLSRRGRRVDFLLCVGDDNADESMFTMLAERQKTLAAARSRTKERRRATSSATAQVAASADAMTGTDASGGGGDAASCSSTPVQDSPDPGPGESTPPATLPPTASLVRPLHSNRNRSFGHALGGRSRRGAGGLLDSSSLLRGDFGGSLLSLASAGSGTSSGQGGSGAGSGKPSTAPVQYTVIVGRKPSSAAFFVDDTLAVERMLKVLSRVATTTNRNRSMNDLSSLTSTSGPGGGMSPSVSHFALPGLSMPPLQQPPGTPAPPNVLSVLSVREPAAPSPPEAPDTKAQPGGHLPSSASMPVLSPTDADGSGPPLLLPLLPEGGLLDASIPRSATAGNLQVYMSGIDEEAPVAF